MFVPLIHVQKISQNAGLFTQIMPFFLFPWGDMFITVSTSLAVSPVPKQVLRIAKTLSCHPYGTGITISAVFYLSSEILLPGRNTPSRAKHHGWVTCSSRAKPTHVQAPVTPILPNCGLVWIPINWFYQRFGCWPHNCGSWKSKNVT